MTYWPIRVLCVLSACAVWAGVAVAQDNVAPLREASVLVEAERFKDAVAVLKTLAQLGAGMDVVSAGEYLRAKAAGVAGDRIVFSGVGKTAVVEGFAQRIARGADGISCPGRACRLC